MEPISMQLHNPIAQCHPWLPLSPHLFYLITKSCLLYFSQQSSQQLFILKDTFLLYVPIICHLDYHKQPSNMGAFSIPLAHLNLFLQQLEYSFADTNLIWSCFYIVKTLLLLPWECTTKLSSYKNCNWPSTPAAVFLNSLPCLCRATYPTGCA